MLIVIAIHIPFILKCLKSIFIHKQCSKMKIQTVLKGNQLTVLFLNVLRYNFAIYLF